MENAQIPASSPSPQVPRRSSLAGQTVAWFCALMYALLAFLAIQSLRPRPHWVPDSVFNGTSWVPDYASKHLELLYPSQNQSLLPALCVVLLVPLLRRRPYAAMALLVLGIAATGTENTSGGTRYCFFIAVDVAVYFLAVRRPRRVSLSTAGVALAVMLLNFTLWPPGDTGLLLTHLSVLTLMIVVAWLLGDALRTRRAHAARLREETAAQAVTTERLRIARELHDMIAHSIGIIAIQAGMGSRVIDTQPAEARKALQAIEETSRDTLSGLRRTLTALRQTDTSTAPTDPAPGLADLAKLVASTRHAGVRVEVATRGMPRPLPGDIDLSAYRIVQESVTNVVRHSGTHSCRVIVSYGDDDLSLEVLDNGHGVFGAAGAGFGLVGMRERVSLLHGDFEAGPRPGGGFRVSARLPIPGFATSYRTVKSAVAAAAPATTPEAAPVPQGEAVPATGTAAAS